MMYSPQLETFLRAADARSFDKAAEESYITPTAVMKQIILRWHTQVGNIVTDHIQANFDLFAFELTGQELAAVAALNKNVRYYTSTPEMLEAYARIVPPVEAQP